MLSSDLPGVNPATLNGMVLYYFLMTKWSDLGDSTELSHMGLSQCGHDGYEQLTFCHVVGSYWLVHEAPEVVTSPKISLHHLI
jgi:hypothetical protein